MASTQITLRNPSLFEMKAITDAQWHQVINALTFYTEVKTAELQTFNAGDQEWQELVDYENTLRDIEYFILMKDLTA